MPGVEPRSLRRAERAAVYALAGWSTEVVFTALREAAAGEARDLRLEGHSYVWMGPIYGLCAVLFEPLHDRLRHRSLWQRAAAYSAGIMTVEYASGRFIARLIGTVPWDYTGRGRLVVHGATRLDYAPLWALAGMALERLDDRLRADRAAQAA